MAKLSPGAQAVLSAFRTLPLDLRDAPSIAAVLRAAGEHIVPSPNQSHQIPGVLAAERQLRAWADELEGGNG